MMNRLTPLLLLLLSACLFTVGCGSKSDGDAHATDEHEHDHGDEPQGEMPTNRIDIPPTVRRNLGITFAPVERRQVSSTIRVPGVFELEPLARHEYRIMLPGEVSLAVDQYEHVEEGDLLYRLRSPQWPELQHEIIESEQAIATANAQIEVAQATIDEAQVRLTSLRERLTALQEAQFRRADLEAEAAELEAGLARQRAELRLAQTTLTNAVRGHAHALHRAASATGQDEADLTAMVQLDGESVPAYRTIQWVEMRASKPGIVEQLHVTDGAYADQTELVLSTVDPSRVRFRATALQADLPRFSDGMTASIVPPNEANLDGRSTTGTVSIGLEAQSGDRTISLLATPAEHQSWMRPGVSGFLEVVTQSTEGFALAIPRSAVVRDGIVYVFFRRDPSDPDKAIRVEADMGVSDGRWVVIQSGLTLNDQVVLDGAYELKLASQQRGANEQGGHFHADGSFHPTDDH